MRKIIKSILMICILICLFFVGILIADKHSLRTQIVRLHVVANSDSKEDQDEKLTVRDAVMCRLEECLRGVSDVTVARQLIKDNLCDLNEVVNNTLFELGSEHLATVTLAPGEFDKREYTTFTLPAGVYESLRIQIGSGQGKNWWCVVFPAFCTPNSSDAFRSIAVSGGFDQGLAETLSNKQSYEFRFFLLDCIGKIENFLNFS